MKESVSVKVQTPQQARSAQTLSKVLDACDVLLQDRLFEQISMQDIAREAGVSVGNLYNRFADRDALIEHIIERHQQEFRAYMAETLTERGDDLPLWERVATIVDTFHAGLANLRPVFATLVTRRLQGYAPGEATRGETDAIIDLAVGWLCQSDKEINGDKTARARFAIASMALGLQFDLLLGTAKWMFGDDYLAQAKVQAYHYLIHSGE